MFSSLLNALFGWLAKPVARTSAQESVSAPELPDHGRNARHGSPPQHWLDAVRNAGPQMRGGSDDPADTVEASPAQEPASEPDLPNHGQNARHSSPPQHWLDAVRNAGPQMRGGSDELGDTVEPSPAAERSVPETQTSPERSLPAKWQAAVGQRPAEDVQFDQAKDTSAPRTSFSARQKDKSPDPTRWIPDERYQKKNVVARFWSWLTGSGSSKSAPIPRPISTEASKSLPPRVLELAKKSEPKEARQDWDPSVQRHRTAVLNFPHREDRQNVREPHYPEGSRGRRSRNLQWAQEVKKPASWVDFPQNHTPSSRFARFSSAVVKHDTPIAANPNPVYWPDLAPIDAAEAASFRVPDRSDVKVESPIESHANVWPELLQATTDDGPLWRSVMRQFARSQRLEKEQRGY